MSVALDEETGDPGKLEVPGHFSERRCQEGAQVLQLLQGSAGAGSGTHGTHQAP
ncbi:MAG: hypothetical protein NO482_08155 [Candidatus Methanomethylicia archaeon]|nr:hypothetical protein [Candidatus Methanomethylicia archaeon]